MATKDPNIFPHDDNYMIFDEEIDKYVLTEYAVNQLGIDLSARVRQKGAVNAEIIVKNTLRQVSMMIYRYLHKHVADDSLQDCIIAKCPSVRPIIRNALEQQLLYYLQVGNLSRATDPEKRLLAIDENAKDILDRIIPELGHSLTYTGRWRYWRY